MKKVVVFAVTEKYITGMQFEKSYEYMEQFIVFHRVDTFYSGGIGGFDRLC